MNRRTAVVLFLSLTAGGILGASAWTAAEPQVQEEGADEKELKMAEEELEEADLPKEEDSKEEEDDGRIRKVAISMPWEESVHLQEQKTALEEALKSLGYEVEVRTAKGQEQAENVAGWIEEGVDALVIHPDPEADLTEALEAAGEQEIPVISFGKLIQNSKDVTALVTFDHLEAGRQIGNYLVSKEGLEQAQKDGDSKTIELFMGSQEDTITLLFYTGLMEVLEPYLGDGTLVSYSGRIPLEMACVDPGDEQGVKEMMEQIFQDFYQGGTPDVICTLSDELAGWASQVVLKQQKEAEEGGEKTVKSKTEKTEEELAAEEIQAQIEAGQWPLITGHQWTEEDIQELVQGVLTASTYGDDSQLGQVCSEVVDALIKGEDAKTETEQYDNGVMIIPARLCQVSTVDKETYETVVYGEEAASGEDSPEENQDADGRHPD